MESIANVLKDAKALFTPTTSGTLKVPRIFTREGQDPFDTVKWKATDAVLRAPDGTEKFRLNGVMVPESWSDRATNIVAEKYFRVVDGEKEKSARQMISRVAQTIATAGIDQGLLSPEDANVFRDELTYILLHQMFAFNSPVWFNVGVPGVRQQASACFIQRVDDTMDSITGLIQKEMHLFKGGSGTGSNLSTLRSSYESLSGGGEASGPVSFMEVLDAGAGVTKSGGTCLAPYQRVYTAEGPVTVKELADRGADFIALSYDPPAGRYKAKIARAWKTGTKPVVVVKTDKGEFHLSYDHPMKLSTGDFCKAGDLNPGQSLFAASIDNRAGYTRVHLRNGKKGKEAWHRLIAQDVMGADLSGRVVHHKNGNKLDNRPENLEVTTQAQHAQTHSNEYVSAGSHAFQLNAYSHDGESNGMHRSSDFWNDPVRTARYRATQGDILVKSGRAAQMQAQAARQKMVNTAFTVMNAGGSIDTFDAYVASRKQHVGPIASIAKVRNAIVSRFGSYDNFVSEVRASNHRVEAVTHIGEMDVYDVEVDCPTVDDKSPTTGHNFVIWPCDDRFGSGVVVSNTRRAAKMVVLNADHPDILTQKNGRPGFITCKSAAEQLAHDLIDTGKYSGEFNVPGNAYERVGFQNANNSVRVTDQFMEAVLYDKDWHTRSVTTGEVVQTYKARTLWNALAEAAWFCGDPGIQYDTTTNKWHTCKSSGRINASNPCSEYLFLDDTACNLGSFNLLRFYDGKSFKADLFAAACRICITAMEILVGYSDYPSPEITENSRNFRPLGIGYANLGALLMYMGYAYDSDEGRSIAGGITALMSGTCYAESAKMASAVGAFPGYAHDSNAEHMMSVMKMHAGALDGLKHLARVDANLYKAAQTSWDLAVSYGQAHGYRNSQISVIAPTGTISFLMDCETTGIEPMLALTVYKKLVGGGYLTMPNAAIAPALRRLGYSDEVVSSAEKAITEGKTLKGLVSADHLAVFQTAIGDDPVSVSGHLQMMAAVQPFLSGGISKTVNMPNTATVADVQNAYLTAWQLGLKCVAIYRDGCKKSQPASAKKEEKIVAAEPVKKGLSWGERKRLPNDRNSFTHKFSIGGQEGYVHTGFYEDGTPGEVFINMAKAGSTLHGVIDMFATAMSVGLQHGVPLDTFIDKLKGTKFEPAGFTLNRDIRSTSSIGDYLGRWFELKFSNPQAAAYPHAVNDQITDAVTQSAAKGQYGDPCSACGNLTVRAGSCWVCTSCGTTTGCG